MFQGATVVAALMLSLQQAAVAQAPVEVAATVDVQEIQWHGQPAFRITTPAATYIYDRAGAGFASLLDADGRDWISYNPGVGEASRSGSGGKFRGIPNASHPHNYCHPGDTKSTSRIIHRDAGRVAIESKSHDGKMHCRWDVFPTHATWTVLKLPTPYWFLYEGTPGGSLDLADDKCVRPAAGGGVITTRAETKWDGDLPAAEIDGEWVYFTDGRRSLFLIQHGDDEGHDSYWPMNGEMTVFGFGRQKLEKFLTRLPARFSFGLVESTDPAQVVPVIQWVAAAVAAK